MFKGLTNRCKKIINQYALFESERYNHKIIQPEHILIAILKEGQSNAYTIMNEVMDLINFQFVLENHINKIQNDIKTENVDVLLYYNIVLQTNISERTKKVLLIAIEESKSIGVKQIDTFSLFLACCKEESSIAHAIIHKENILLEDIKNSYYKYITNFQGVKVQKPNDIEKNNTHAPHDMKDISDIILPEIKNVSFQKFMKDLDISIETNIPSHHQSSNDKKQTVEDDKKVSNTLQQNDVCQYLVNMNQLALEGKFHSIFGRRDELQEIFKILLRKQKHNPILVGDPGVGKSAIIEELALQIVEGKVPLQLLNAEVLQLDVAALTAGTRYRGDFEERLLKVITELKKRKEAGKFPILFIDEFHHIVGAGLATGLSMDGAGILKPALARGEICCVGITTDEEFRKHIESDKAFLRRLQKITIPEMSGEDTYLTLQTLKSEYEKKHNVIYEDSSLQEIIRLSNHYIFDRFFPDKAVDFLDEVGAYFKLQNSDTPKELVALYKKEYEIHNNDKKISENPNSNHINTQETALEKANELQSIIERKNTLKDSLLKNVEKQEIIITPENIRTVMSISTGIPSDRLDENKTDLLQKLELGLQADIVGQETAVSSLIATVKRSFVGLHKGTRPVGSFLFLGPTGVGKTYTVKKLAQHLFGSEDAVTRFDMSDFAEPNSINRLIGAPPGYVGFEESGILLKIMRKKPRQVLLFDEIEKAHSRVFDMFLQILEEGALQGQMGEMASFKHSIIVMTSNIGSEELLSKKNFGFGKNEYSSEYVNTIIHEKLSTEFRPELINRFDEIIIFDPLDDKNILNVIGLMTQDLSKILDEQNITLNIHTSVYEHLYDNFYNIEFGARSIRRGIRAIENYIAEIMIHKNISQGDKLSLSVRKGNFFVKTFHPKTLPKNQFEKNNAIHKEIHVV